MGKWGLLLLAVTVTMTVEQLEKLGHDKVCWAACRKTPPHQSGYGVKIKKTWFCRCTNDYEESDLTLPSIFSRFTGEVGPDPQPPQDSN